MSIKKSTIRKTPQSSKPTIFDILNHLTLKTKSWDELTVEEKDCVNPYMINRFISMDKDYIQLINVAQKVSDKEKIYKIYFSMLPKKQKFFKYIKKTKTKEYSNELLEMISTYFACSHSEASSYIDILEKESIVSILKEMGIDDKQIKKLLK
jgi:hypothetical protein